MSSKLKGEHSMLSRIHNKLGTAGVVLGVIALILALGGTALAAKGAFTGKQKKEIAKIAKKEAKKYAGKPGAPGAPGTAGTNGTNGTNGKDGTAGEKGEKGDTGNNGENVEVNAYEGTECPGTEEGAEFTNGTGTAYACNGTFEPNGFTQTGTFGADSETLLGLGTMSEGGSHLVQAGFTVPLETAPQFVFVPGTTSGAGTGGFGANAGAGCPGVSGGTPQAGPGKFCVYGFAWDAGAGPIPSAETTAFGINSFNGEPETTPAGALLKLACEDGGAFEICYGKGLWAVTG